MKKKTKLDLRNGYELIIESKKEQELAQKIINSDDCMGIDCFHNKGYPCPFMIEYNKCCLVSRMGWHKMMFCLEKMGYRKNEN